MSDSSSNQLGNLQARHLSTKQLVLGGQPDIVGPFVGIRGSLHAARPDYDIGDATRLQCLLCLLLEGQNAPEQVQQACK